MLNRPRNHTGSSGDDTLATGGVSAEPVAPVSSQQIGAGKFYLLFLFLGFILTFGLGHRGLNEPDEGRYGEMAMEMVQGRANWWEPKLSGFGHYDKPPLIYWTTAIFFKTFGVNETAARMPSLLGAVLSLAGVGWAARRLYGRDLAWWSILICGTLGQFWLLGRFLTPDMLLSGWCALAVAAWAECRHRNGVWAFWFLSLIFWTLAWWTKATAAFVPLVGLVLGVWILRDSPGKKAMRLRFLLPAILILGSPWYVSMMMRHRELTGFFFGRELAGRVVGHVTGRKGPIYYYLAVSLVAWMPWAPLILILGWKTFWSRFKRGWRWGIRAIGWEGWIAGVGLLIFSLISSKLPTYTLPIAPWIAVLLARSLIKLQTEILPIKLRRWIYATLAVYVSILIAIVVAAPRFESRLGANSSMRPVASALRERGAQRVFMDQYWPGMEVYFGERVVYVVGQSQRQLRLTGEDQELTGAEHFRSIETWKKMAERWEDGDAWLVRYVKNRNSPFNEIENSSRAKEKIQIGNFVLSKISNGPE